MRSFIFFTPIVRQIKSRRMRWAGYVACMGEEMKLYRILEGKKHLGRPRRRREDAIRMDLRKRLVGECRVDPNGSG
jgi:hypothetical protein